MTYLLLLLGLVLAGVGGELFVRGTVGLAAMARVAPGIVGATVAAFATSSPELSVAITAASSGRPEISLGDALGSNVVNVALVLGLALTMAGMRCDRRAIVRDYSFALAVPALIAILLVDGTLTRFDGLVLLALFFVWLVVTVAEARRQRSEASVVLGAHRPWSVIASSLAGIACLLAAGQLIVAGARGIAAAYGVGEFVVGATLVALGTSVPELATTLIARWRGHNDMGLGTVLGSNVFNGLFVVGVAAVIHPIVVAWRDVLIALAFGVLSTMLVFPSASGMLGRPRGLLFLVLYVGYVAKLFQHGPVGTPP